ncbi:MAG: hypothetical protein AAGG02_14490 [Cyanobacteria bacterium P01_H01_bin.15]
MTDDTKQTKDYQLYDLLIGEGYEQGGEQRTSWTNVGTIFRDAATGNLSGRVKDGLALSGRFIIKPRTQKQKAPAL